MKESTQEILSGALCDYFNAHDMILMKKTEDALLHIIEMVMESAPPCDDDSDQTGQRHNGE